MKSIAMRCAALILALVLASGAQATIRYWQLTNVQLDDGSTVTGNFGFDDATGFPTTWNIHVQASPSPAQYVVLPFTYVPGNSGGGTNFASPGIPPGEVVIGFSSPEGGDTSLSPYMTRLLNITATHLLDGTLSPIPLDLATPSHLGGVEGMNGYFYRVVVSGSLVLMPFPPPVALIEVVEFFHAAQDHYFISADPAEINGLDTGYFPGWTRTGGSFKAYVAGSSAGPSIHPVCRFYRPPIGGKSTHFYSGDEHECVLMPVLFGDEWTVESDNVFQIALPDKTTGVCPGGTVPVYRLFNNVFATPNHRYTTSLAVVATMVAMGWVREGYGPDAIIMCAVP